MNRVKGMWKGGVVLLLALLAAGCASSPQVKERYLWPRPPETARVEWLGAYQNERDMKAASFMGELMAVEEPRTLKDPFYVTADGAGKVYVGDFKNLGVLVFDFVRNKVHLLGENYEKRARLPTGVALDADGNLYVADSVERLIYVYDKDERQKAIYNISGQVTTIGAMAIDQVRKHLVVPDIRGHKIAVFDLSGKLLFSVGKRGEEPGQFNYPDAVAIDKEGNILVSDQMNARIQRLSPEGKPLFKFGQRGDGPGEFALPKGVAVDSEGHIYVTDGKNHKFGIYDEKGQFLLDIGSPYTFDGHKINPGGFHTPQGIFIDKNDTIYIVDSSNTRIQVFQYLGEGDLQRHPFPPAPPGSK
jgi:DNA-binding beta-propeller fold protein YncE